MDRAAVVTCFLRNRGAVLLLERAADAETYPGRWAAVTGYVEGDDPVATARAEIREETGLTDVSLVRVGEAFTVRDDQHGREWTIHPFLFDVDSRDVRFDEEAIRAEWVPPTAILRRETVPDLWTSYDRVRPTPDSIRDDEDHGAAWLSVRALEVLRDAAALADVDGGSVADVATVAEDLLAARQSMAVVRNRVNRAMHGASTPVEVETATIDGIERALDADAAAAEAVTDAIEELASPGGDATVLTLSRSGTVSDALLAARPRVIVAESRPAREGVGVAEDLAGAGLDVTLCTDAAVAHVLAESEVDAVLVGADTVLPDGGVVNKTGTRGAALAAAREGTPFYAVAASDKVAPEPGAHLESGPPAAVYGGDADVAAVNPTFDVTAPDLVDAVVTERGLLSGDDVARVAEELRELAGWMEQQ